MSQRPPLPPFTLETATQKARMAEDAWNSRDPERVSLAYTEDSRWRNRSEFFTGRPAIVAFLKRKWEKELDYRLIKELWAFHESRIAVRFQYEWRDAGGEWYRAYGNDRSTSQVGSAPPSRPEVVEVADEIASDIGCLLQMPTTVIGAATRHR